LNCSSDDVPEGHTAEFLEDGGTLTNIRIHRNKCFTTLAGAACQPRVCQCSKDKRSYVVYHQLILKTNMQFEKVKRYLTYFINISFDLLVHFLN